MEVERGLAFLTSLATYFNEREATIAAAGRFRTTTHRRRWCVYPNAAPPPHECERWLPTKTMPNRLQQKRTKGWRKPANSVVISRPSKWGNPFPIDAEHDRAAVVALFRAWIGGPDARAEKMRAEIDELRGKDLLCFCPVPGPCHGDILLELANRRS
jgi:hypothetical protein